VPDGVLELVQALLAHVAPAGFEPVAEELESLPRYAAIADMRLLGMQRPAVRLYPHAHLVKRGVGGLARPAQDHEVIRVPHHAIAARGHQLVQRVEIDVGQQRADYALNAKDKFQFEREIRGWRQCDCVLDLRRKR
jgi:hypothetical protein